MAEDRGSVSVGRGATNQLVVNGALLRPTVDFSAFSTLMIAFAADIFIAWRRRLMSEKMFPANS